MKKTLIALAAVAAVSAASAQSTVTLYGVVDMAVASLKDTNGLGQAAVDTQKVGINQGILSRSRIGFKGTEDLGGGLKANFVMEYGTSPDESASIGANRLGTVGVSGNFGAVTLGRQYTPYHVVQGAVDLYGNLNDAPGYVVNAHNRARASNAVQYASPSISGFSGIVQVGAGGVAGGTESAVTGGNAADGKNYGLAAIYAAGPLLAGFAYDSVTNPAAAVAGYAPITGGANLVAFGGAGSAEVKVWAAGASYDFGIAKAAIAYSSLTDSKIAVGATDLTSKGYNLSVAAPFGPVTVLGNLGRADAVQTSTKTDAVITGYQLGANYSLSKRTTAYALIANDTVTAAGVTGDYKRNTTAVGLRHTF